MNTSLLITTSEHITGREIGTVLGLVKGSTIRSRHIGRDITAGLKSIVGGEMKGYVTALNDARTEATDRMVAEALQLGADAIIATRYTTSQIMAGAAEILVYGTAVTFK